MIKFMKQGRSDKSRFVQVSIHIPLWMYEPFEQLNYTYRKWKYKLFPDRCDVCGTRMYVRNYEIEHHFDNHQRLLVHNFATEKKSGKYRAYCVCRNCLADKLETEQWQPRFTQSSIERDGKPSRYNYRFWRAKQCAVLKKKVDAYKDVEIYPYVDMTFCTIAWNYEHVSKEAVIETVRKGKIKTSMWGVYKRQKMCSVNHKGLFINEDGELL